MKILFIDLETSPSTAYVWGIWKENIPLARLIDSSTVLCWSAKWYGSEEIMFDSIMESRPKTMIKRMHKLLEEADVVVHYYGSKFDLPVLNREFLLHNLPPPAPYRSLDLLTTVRRQFKFISNKLDYVAQRLGLGKKHETNFKLWVDCMNKDPVAWKQMKEYNIQDVILLEKLYGKLRTWIPNHPNHGLYGEGGLVCPTCGSSRYNKRGYAYLTSGKYSRYQCSQEGCRKWFRGSKNLAGRPDSRFRAII